MPSAFSKSIPVAFYTGSTNGDFKQISTTNENFYAYAGGQGIVNDNSSVSSRFHNSLTSTNTALDSAIGSYTDTFYTDPVGTHSGSSLNSGSTTTTLYQMKDSDGFGHYGDSNTPNKPVAVDSSGDIWEMDSAAFTRLGVRVAEVKNTNDYPGTFYLSSTQPSGDYRKWIDVVFTDTRAVGDVDYHIWQRETMTTPPTAANFYALKLKDSDQPHLQEMSLLQLQTSMASCILAGEQESGIGDYELRSSAQGVPTRPGTWVAKGTAVDTRNVIDSDATYATSYTSPFYTSQFTRQYTGQYTRLEYADVPSTFVGFRQAAYAGSRNYSHIYGGSRNFSGQYAGSRLYAAATGYAGSRTFSGNYSGSRSFASSPVQYAQLNVTFSGQRFSPGTFAGTRVSANTTFTGTRPSSAYFVGPAGYLGSRYFVGGGAGTFAGFRPANFAGDRVFVTMISGQYAGTTPGNFSGNRTSSPTSFAGNRTSSPTSFAGTRLVESEFSQGPYGGYYTGTRQEPGSFTGTRQVPGNFTGTREVPGNFSGTRPAIYAGGRFYSGNYLGPSPGDFSGFRATDYLGTRYFVGTASYLGTRQVAGNFVGTRQVPANFVGTRATAGNFVGNRYFAGSRTYADDYSGSRLYAANSPGYSGSRNFAGQYAGSRNYSGGYAGSRNYSSSPTQYLGPAPAVFSGTRPATYTGQYAGQYASQYTGQFTSFYTTQYTGETITLATETIETYTLYRKVAQ
jgi:hypothetical protein